MWLHLYARRHKARWLPSVTGLFWRVRCECGREWIR